MQKHELFQGGMSLDEALTLFLSACNQGPDVLFITDSWIAPRLEALREGLDDPITEEQAVALRDALLQVEPIDRVVGWLSHANRIFSWQGYKEAHQWLRRNDKAVSETHWQ